MSDEDRDLWKELEAYAKERSMKVTKQQGTLTGWWVHVRWDGSEKDGYQNGRAFRAETLDDAILSAKLFLVSM